MPGTTAKTFFYTVKLKIREFQLAFFLYQTAVCQFAQQKTLI